MKRLEDKIAIVTGGARGIGAATVRRFAAEGARVVAWDLAFDSGSRSDSASDSASVREVVVDVVDADAVAAAVDDVIGSEGGVDILINNAGIVRDNFAEKLDLAAWEDVLRVNLTGTFIPCRAIIPHFKERGRGRIVNTSSVSAFGNLGQSNYAASKAGVIALTRTLALELARDGVTVNAVAPGAVDTDMLAQVPQKVLDKVQAKIPLGRLARAEDIAAVHAFLASEEAAYITGQTIICDGGMTI